MSLGLAHGHSFRAMARILGQASSALSREVARNTIRAYHPRRVWKLLDPWLWQHITTQLIRGCLPEQVPDRLRRLSPGDMSKQLSTETIYTALCVLPRGALRTELLAALRQARKAHRPRARDHLGQIPKWTARMLPVRTGALPRSPDVCLFRCEKR